MPTEASTATLEPSPASTRTVIPTPFPPTPTSPSAVCPPPSSPVLARPAGFQEYPDAIQAYLSAGGDLDTLESKLTAWSALPDAEDQVVSADLNGDSVDEIILAVVDPEGHVMTRPGVLLVLECSERAYIRLYREGSGETEAFDPSIRIVDVDDLTMDGLSEVVYVLRTCGAHTCYERLKVLGWQDAQLVNLMGGTLDLPYPSYEIELGRIEATSGGIGSVGAEPQRAYTEIWTWNGTVFTRTKTVHEPPVYRYHALLDADRALWSGDYVTAVEAYHLVIEDNTLKEWGGVTGMMTPAEERAQLSAFSHWRLVLSYLLMDKPGDAQVTYDSLRREYQVGASRDVVWMAETFWEAYRRTGSVSEGCAVVLANVESYPSVLDFFNRSYGYANPLWEPKDLCPF